MLAHAQTSIFKNLTLLGYIPVDDRVRNKQSESNAVGQEPLEVLLLHLVALIRAARRAPSVTVMLQTPNVSVFFLHPPWSRTYLFPQSSKPLLLGMSVDISPNAERQNVEEWHPSLLWEELLGKCQRQWRGDPADAHDRPEASADGGPDLMPGAGTGNDSHRREVYGVLDRRDLLARMSVIVPSCARKYLRTTKLLVKIWRIFAFKLVRPANTHCSKPMSTCPIGAEMNAPYAAILGILEEK